MELLKIDESHAETARKMIRAVFLPLLQKYHDEKESPANKTIEDLRFDLRRERSDAYLLMLDGEAVGYVRVGQKSDGYYSIADLAILPEHQGKGYAQYFLREIERLYPMAEKWKLITVAEEKKDCHLYEKMGYVQVGILREIHENMHFVLYVKEKKK